MRLLRDDEGTVDVSFHTSDDAGSPPAHRAERKTDGGDGFAFGDIETARRRSDAEQHLDFLPEKNEFDRVGGRPSGSADFTSDAEDGNFEDEFDPILASIRKPPAASSASPSAARSLPATTPFQRGCGEAAGASPSYNREAEASHLEEKGTPSAGPSFAAGILSMFPGDMRARAGDVMAQSSARISESASVFRSALESGVPSAGKTKGGKRRQSDPPTDGLELVEEGKGGKGAASRRTAGVGDEQDIRMVSVNELLSEEEVRSKRDVEWGRMEGCIFFSESTRFALYCVEIQDGVWRDQLTVLHPQRYPQPYSVTRERRRSEMEHFDYQYSKSRVPLSSH